MEELLLYLTVNNLFVHQKHLDDTYFRYISEILTETVKNGKS